MMMSSCSSSRSSSSSSSSSSSNKRSSSRSAISDAAPAINPFLSPLWEGPTSATTSASSDLTFTTHPRPTTRSNTSAHKQQQQQQHHIDKLSGRRKQSQHTPPSISSSASSSPSSSWEIQLTTNWMKVRTSSHRLFRQVNSLLQQDSSKKSDPKLLLGVLACPLVPTPLIQRLFHHHHHHHHHHHEQQQQQQHEQQHQDGDVQHMISPSAADQKGSRIIPLVERRGPRRCGAGGGTAAAHYIVQQYAAAAGAGAKSSCLYARGRLTMQAAEFETATRIAKQPIKATESGSFVLWLMYNNTTSINTTSSSSSNTSTSTTTCTLQGASNSSTMSWHMEMELEGHRVESGCHGGVIWRSASWLPPHLVKGPAQRPLRRMLQGLDPVAIASVFADAKCVGEKAVPGSRDECFVLELSVDPDTLRSARRTDGSAWEVLRHTLRGYFSQRTGLLVFVEDSYLTRTLESSSSSSSRVLDNVQGPEGCVYWETTTESWIRDYRRVDGVNIAHSGHTAVTIFRFGEEAMSHTKTRMEEMWEVQEVSVDVQGLSRDFFLPPSEALNNSGKSQTRRTTTASHKRGAQEAAHSMYDQTSHSFPSLLPQLRYIYGP